MRGSGIGVIMVSSMDTILSIEKCGEGMSIHENTGFKEECYQHEVGATGGECISPSPLGMNHDQDS